MKFHHTYPVMAMVLATLLSSCQNSKSSIKEPVRDTQPKEQTRAVEQVTTPHNSKEKKDENPISETNENRSRETEAKASFQPLPSLYASTGLTSVKRLVLDRFAQKNYGNEKAAEQLALSIEDVKIGIVDSSNRVILKMIKDKKTIILSGKLNERGIAHIKATSKSPIEAKVICLDRIETQCFNTLIEIRDLSYQGATVYILNQKTNANFKFKARVFDEKRSSLEHLSHYLSNTEKQLNTLKSLRSILVETFEVIGGKSATRIAFIARDGQVIKVQGPLYKSATDIEVTNIPLELDEDLDDLLPFERFVGTMKTSLAESISEIALIQYNQDNHMTLSFRDFQTGRHDESLIVELFCLKPQIKSTHYIKLLLDSK